MGIRRALKTLQTLLQTQQTAMGSFYTLSHMRFIHQSLRWKAHMPGITPYYAVKCNPDKILLNWLVVTGAKFDCASAREMDLVKDVFQERVQGEVKNSIVFANPCKTPNDIEAGKELQVPLVVADSVEECEKMQKAGYRPNTLLRVAVDDSSSRCPFNLKFGLKGSVAVEKVARAAKDMNIPITGLSFHVGSGCTSPSAFGSAVETCKSLWNTLEKKSIVGKFETLDIGGGWSPEENEFVQQSRSAMEALSAVASSNQSQPEKVIAEPGRFFAAPTHNLYVRVIGKKPIGDGSEEKGWRYTLDESIYGQFSCIPFDHAEPRIARIKRDQSEQERPKTRAVFFGRTCDSLDWIGTSIETEELEVGDWLYIPDMGAYTTATSTEFNGFPKPSTLICSEEPDEKMLVWCKNMKYPLAKALNINEMR